jgi:Rha family phage regulatory protein
MKADLFPEALLVSHDGGCIYTDSLRVAAHFGKRHKHVLDRIKSMLGEGNGPDFRPVEPEILVFNLLNFERVEYRDAKGEQRPVYRLTHDGFALLVMGFTGKVAALWKIRFLAAFRALERELAVLKERESTALYSLRPRWKAIVDHPDLPRAGLIQLTGHKTPASITACRRRMREVGLLDGRT